MDGHSLYNLSRPITASFLEDVEWLGKHFWHNDLRDWIVAAAWPNTVRLNTFSISASALRRRRATIRRLQAWMWIAARTRLTCRAANQRRANFWMTMLE